MGGDELTGVFGSEAEPNPVFLGAGFGGIRNGEPDAERGMESVRACDMGRD